MTIIHNGHRIEIPAGTSLGSFVRRWSRPDAPMMVRLNGELVPAGRRDAANLAEGDRLDIVLFMGGG